MSKAKRHSDNKRQDPDFLDKNEPYKDQGKASLSLYIDIIEPLFTSKICPEKNGLKLSSPEAVGEVLFPDASKPTDERRLENITRGSQNARKPERNTSVDTRNREVSLPQNGLENGKDCNRGKSKLVKRYRKGATKLPTVGPTLKTAQKRVYRIRDKLGCFKMRSKSSQPDALINVNNPAISHKRHGRLSDAIEVGEKILRMHKRTLGKDHPDALTSMNNLTIS